MRGQKHQCPFLGKWLPDVIRPGHFFFSSWLWRALSWGWASQVPLMVNNPPELQDTQETWVQSLGQKDPLEEEMATHSSILAWRIAWTVEAWQATVHRIAKSQTQLEWLSTDTWAEGRQMPLCSSKYLSLFRQVPELPRAPLESRDPVIVAEVLTGPDLRLWGCRFLGRHFIAFVGATGSEHHGF